MDHRRKAAYRKIPRHMRRNCRAREWRQPGSRRRLSPARLLVALGALTLVLFLAWLRPGVDPLSFSSEAWLRASEQERGRMVDDFLAEHRVEGMPQDTLLALLGAPDREVTVAARVERHREDAEAPEVTPWYGADAPGRLSSAAYRIGTRAFRAGVPMLPRYWLELSLRDGKVDAVWIAD